jgi:Zn-dependent protease/CBS domain-containing protein
MFTTRWRLFRVLGIPIYVDASWLIVLALITWTLHAEYRARLPELGAEWAWLLALATAVAFFVCIVLHEMGHALTARASGIPMGGITLFLFGGVAELRGEPPSARSEFLVAIAGPAVSAVLAAGFWLLAQAAITAGWNPAVPWVLTYLWYINLIVLIFNLIPAFPLDGGRVLRSILWGATGNLHRATYWAALAGQVFAWLLMLLGVLRLIGGDFTGGLWSIFIGMFLNSAARSGYQNILVRQALQGEPVRRFMNPEPITVPPDLDLRTFVEDYVYRHHRKTFPVVRDGRLVGLVSTRDLAGYPRDAWAEHSVREVMHTDLEGLSIRPDNDALTALGKMQATGSSRLLVLEEGRLVGLVSLKDLLRFLDLKLQLEGPGEGGPAQPHPRAPAHHENQIPS